MTDHRQGIGLPVPGPSGQPGRYGPGRRPRWISLGIIVVLHGMALLTLPYLTVEYVRRVPMAPLVVDLLPLDPPPSQPVALPMKKMAVRTPEQPRIVVPPPLVAVPAQSAPVVSIAPPEPAPLDPVKVGQAAPAPVETVDTVANLNTRLLSAAPPSYPMESRRRHETGTVVLMVEVNEEGRVSTISVAESSGAERLDKAALDAVRRWRWSPTTVGGRVGRVRGLVRIPFELRNHDGH